MSEKYMVKQTIAYSDGTETVLNYEQNGAAVEIEATVAEAVAGDHKVSRDVFPETVSASEPVVEVENVEASEVE